MMAYSTETRSLSPEWAAGARFSDSGAAWAPRWSYMDHFNARVGMSWTLEATMGIEPMYRALQRIKGSLRPIALR